VWPKKCQGDNQKWLPRNGCDGRLLITKFNNDNLGEFGAESETRNNGITA